MKIPVALTMLASPFSLPHNERWILPIALGFFTLLTVCSGSSTVRIRHFPSGRSRAFCFCT